MAFISAREVFAVRVAPASNRGLSLCAKAKCLAVRAAPASNRGLSFGSHHRRHFCFLYLNRRFAKCFSCLCSYALSAFAASREPTRINGRSSR